MVVSVDNIQNTVADACETSTNPRETRERPTWPVAPVCAVLCVSRFSVVNDLKGEEAYDSVEYSRAFFTLFEGAIYLHQVMFAPTF